MKRIVVAGRNDSGKSTIVGELYKGLTSRGFQPLVIGSGIQDEKPYLMKGIDANYLIVATPEPGYDIVNDIERVIRNGVNQIKEKNMLIQHAKKALDELNKVRSVLELGHLSQRDIPKTATLPNVVIMEAVGINDGYKTRQTREVGDILVSIVPAGVKPEILMETTNFLLDEADIIVVTKIDETHRSVASANIKLLQRIYRHKPIIPVVATEGIHTELVIEEIIKRVNEPTMMLDLKQTPRPKEKQV